MQNMQNNGTLAYLLVDETNVSNEVNPSMKPLYDNISSLHTNYEPHVFLDGSNTVNKVMYKRNSIE